MKVQITLTDCLNNGKMTIDTVCKSEISSFVKRQFKKNVKQIVSFLSGFGDAFYYVMDMETGEVLCDGKFTCNVFSGKNTLVINL